MADTRAFDLWFETDEGISFYPAHVLTLRPRPESLPQGWTGSAGPGVRPEMWPRDPDSGVPMAHAITLRLPLEYQRRGERYPGVSFFQGGSRYPRVKPTGLLFDDPLARPHPMQELPFDSLGISAALVWLTEEELSRPPRPFDVSAPAVEEMWPNAWRYQETRLVWIEERDDSNAGRAPRDVQRGEVIPAGE